MNCPVLRRHKSINAGDVPAWKGLGVVELMFLEVEEGEVAPWAMGEVAGIGFPAVDSGMPGSSGWCVVG